jgi:hypothetical protein
MRKTTMAINGVAAKITHVRISDDDSLCPHFVVKLKACNTFPHVTLTIKSMITMISPLRFSILDNEYGWHAAAIRYTELCSNAVMKQYEAMAV